MPRPRYESKEDRDNEKRVGSFLGQLWNCEFVKLNEYKYVVDFLIKSGKEPHAFAELKCLNRQYDSYPFMISFTKILAAEELCSLGRIPFILLFRCNDELCFHTWDFNRHYKLEWGGRTATTRDKEDVELVFRIPIEDCKTIRSYRKNEHLVTNR